MKRYLMPIYVALYCTTIMLIVTLAVFFVAGCDEGTQMVGPVITEPSETEPTEPAETPPTTMGEVKQPKPEPDTEPEPTTVGEVKQPEDPGEQPEPTEPEPKPSQEPLEVLEINYYADADLTMSLSEAPYFGTLLYEVGEEIYTEVVFSGEVPVVTSDDPVMDWPRILYRFIGKVSTYRMRSRETDVSRLESGDAKPYGETGNVFLCKFLLPEIDPERGNGEFRTFYSRKTWSDHTPPVLVTRSGKNFDITDPPLITTLLAGADATHPAPVSDPEDFVGRVCIPFSARGDFSEVQPVPGVTVTITVGPRSGEQVTTDLGGYYLFPNVEGDELHLRVEKEHFEPKEVIVHRSHPTTLQAPKSGIDLKREGTGNPIWKRPGAIFIGQRWPDEIRFIFEEMFLPNDLLLFVDDRSTFAHLASGFYGEGVVVLYDHRNPYGTNYGTDMSNGTILHEITHAHQHALAILEFGEEGSVGGWEGTPEGRAYKEARAKDWRRFGKTRSDNSTELIYPENSHLYETAAGTAAFYWGIEYLGGISYLRTKAPNRLRWAQEWLNKRY